ncbi:MAG: hypothetical protein U0M21_08750 [Emergencia sp.]|nr:hypothetical protein [Emergencia sp.]
MKRMKRLIAALVSVIMVLTMTGQGAFAAGYQYENPKDIPNAVVDIFADNDCKELYKGGAKVKISGNGFDTITLSIGKTADQYDGGVFVYGAMGKMYSSTLKQLGNKVPHFQTSKTTIDGIQEDFAAWIEKSTIQPSMSVIGASGKTLQNTEVNAIFMSPKTFENLKAALDKAVSKETDGIFTDYLDMIEFLYEDDEFMDLVWEEINAMYQDGTLTYEQAEMAVSILEDLPQVLDYVFNGSYGGFLMVSGGDIIECDCGRLAAPEITKTGTSLSGKPTLTWNKVEDAAKYEVYRSGYRDGEYKKMYTTTSTSYTNTSANPGYTYFYKVKALTPNGASSDESNVVAQKCVEVKVDVTKGSSSTGKPTLTWDKVNGAAKYEIYRSGYSNGKYTKMYTTDKTTYTNTSASPGYTYYYKVKAVSKGGTTFAESPAIKQLCYLEKPELEKGVRGDGKPMLTWDKVPGATKYEIYRSGYSDGKYTKMYTTTKTSYTNTSAKAGYSYYYKVVAVSGNNQKANATSEVVKQKCMDKGLVVTKGNNSAGKPTLTWKSVPGATEYEVYRSGYRDGTYTKMYTTTKTSYTNTSAKKGYTYFYKVVAICDGSASADFIQSPITSVKCK